MPVDCGKHLYLTTSPTAFVVAFGDINLGAKVPMQPATRQPMMSMIILLVESLIFVEILLIASEVNILARAKKDVTAR